MLPNERVVHDGLTVQLQDLLELVDVVILVAGHQIRHRQDLRVVFVRLGFLNER